MRRGLGSYDESDDDPRGRIKPFEVNLFVHKILGKSLLCSEQGKQDYLNGQLVKGKIVPWSLIIWPKEGEREKFRSFELIKSPSPEQFTFAVPEWFAHKNGLI